ncbi:hypothetical protein [Gemmata obscuriglobus]|uniref:hypothetical protein n=1 Tax=Gemmata obscuriglobus TaxID=114 RepID=UPI0011CDC62D|nr:hypothetical protein [Gemmata obscuriglobus]
MRSLRHALVAVESFFLHDWFVPSAVEAIPSNKPLRELVERDLLWPLRQDVVGRLSARFLLVGLLTAGLSAALSRGDLLTHVSGSELLIQTATLGTSVAVCLVTLIALGVFELVVPTHVGRASVLGYFDGSTRKGNPVGDWLYNALLSVKLGNLGAVIPYYINASREHSFSPESRDELRRVDAAVRNAVEGIQAAPKWNSKVFAEVVGEVTYSRCMWHLVMYLAGVAANLFTVAAFRLPPH